MLKCILTIIWSLVLTASLFAQGGDSLGMEMLYNYDDDSLPSSNGGVSFNDCWGYTDDAGNEYAILGGYSNVFFFDITDPENTTLIRRVDDNDPDISGNVDLDNSIWRDFKTYGDKAYSCADQGNEGLIIYDLSQLPDTVTIDRQITTHFTRSHNIFIDTARGYLYTAGARLGSTYHDVIILDLNNDPPTVVADVSIPGGYMHDVHVVDDIAYCNSETSDLHIVDFTDPQNPVAVGDLDSYTGSGYNHSGWLTEDGNYYVFCDETQGRKVKILDVSDPASISNSDITDQFFSNLVNENATNPSSLAHNPFIIGDLVYVAYYDDGVQVFNISDPTNVVREAYYDTNVNTNYANNNGVWGVYPFFDSGSIIASDIENGLYVLQMIDGTLLVDLIEFNATRDQNKVKLNWATALERNSNVFEVERSLDGEKFETIKTIEANENSSTRIDYQTYDESPMRGINYYRLKQTDIDGTFQYSDIKTVQFFENKVSLNPTFVDSGQPINLYLEEAVNDLSIQVLNVNGQLIKSYAFQYANSGVQEIPTNDLQEGLYVLRIQFDQNSLSEKVMIAR